MKGDLRNGVYVGLVVMLYACIVVVQLEAALETKTCFQRKSPCFLKKQTCPKQCPSFSPPNGSTKACVIDCFNPICKATCRNRKPNCNGKGSACLDPRFIGGDGIVFYFHGKRDEHFALISDVDFQVNARFIGLRPNGRARDFTWIQSLGLIFCPNSKTFSLEATKAEKWDHQVDHLRLSYEGKEISLPKGDTSVWSPPLGDYIKIERTSDINSVLVTLQDIAEIWINVVPVTKEDDIIHKYGIPEDDCFAHLEVQFRFLKLSSNVEGVLGRTYKEDFKNPAKPGVAMPVVGGEDKYRTASLLETSCNACVYSGGSRSLDKIEPLLLNQNTVDCTGGSSSGVGIFCRK
ncbi:hypothetical protein AtNW77_Chr1g0054881 [Arabidopsis thaliana]|uniref:Late embryogenesis abundant (LEA) protein-like protein n=2 Tax=Arabidopsis TaxID=3701 RepID=A0A178WFF2_ARATH|nr:Root cap [Arabidopsis thaliana x Arabidopsis arenosa]OAP16153.1 hypothetical protein AXX17_AT1G49370 [Arabidopsis thaliana]